MKEDQAGSTSEGKRIRMLMTMSNDEKEIGIVGLGSMGLNISKVLLRNGYALTVYNRSVDKYAHFNDSEEVTCTSSMDEFAEKLQQKGKDAVVWMMLPGGEPTNSMLSELSSILNKGSVIIDGSNSDSADSVSNYNKLRGKGIEYLDVGVAGGPDDVLKGVAIMAGGDKETFDKVKEILQEVAGGRERCGYVGESGSGHRLKAAHNSIFYSIFPIFAETAAAVIEQNNGDKETAEESLRLLSIAPPITKGIPEAILNAFRSGELLKEAPKVSVSKMVSSYVDSAEKKGTPLDITKEVLKSYPEMRDSTKAVYSGAKKVLTGH